MKAIERDQAGARTSTTSFSAILKDLSATSVSRLDLWVKIINRFQAENMLEVGVWKGVFAARTLAQCKSIKRYYMLDPWRKLDAWNKPCNKGNVAFDKTFREAMETTRFAETRRIVLRGTTSEMIKNIPDDTLDIAYIDGDHTLRGITIDLITAYQKVKIGGFLAGDDLAPSIWQHGTKFEPTFVFPFSAYFAEAVGMSFFALPYEQFLIAKLPQGSAYTFTDFTGKYQNLSLREQFLPSSVQAPERA